jgi:hypothetical protein
LRIKNEEARRDCGPRATRDLLAPDPSWAVLQPGETRIFHVAFAVLPRKHRSEIIVESGGGKLVSVPITGRVSPQAGSAEVPSAALTRGAPAVNASPPQTANSIAAVKEIKTLKAGNRIFEIAGRNRLRSGRLDHPAAAPR